MHLNHLYFLFIIQSVFQPKDQWGVKSPVAQWIEWLASVPLMFFLNIALDDRKECLTMTDGFVIFSSWVSIASCWLLNWNLPSHLLIPLLTSSTLFMAVALMLNFYTAQSAYIEFKAHVESSTKLCVTETRYLRILLRKYNGAIFILKIFPSFAVLYFGKLFDYISDEHALIGFLILNFVTKLMFSLWMMDSHHDILDTNELVLLAEQKANESRRSFLRYVLHEVRVPLNTITMGLHLLEEEDDEKNDSIAMMSEAVSFMSDTLNDVLSIQKIEEGKLELQFANFYISDVMKTVRHSLRGYLVSKDIRLIEDVHEDVPDKVKGDRFRIEHVLANFVSNAIKFSPTNGTVTITVKNISPPADQTLRPGYQLVEFTVIDEGVGISEEDQKHLFNYYVQINPGVLQAGKGTGIGLAICRETVLLHGGKIGVRSRQGTSNDKGGSEFFFSIDFEIIEQVSSRLLDDEEQRSEVKSGSRTKMLSDEAQRATNVQGREKPLILTDKGTWNVLITDDVASNRKLLSMLLKREGIGSHQAVDGAQCVELVKQNINYFDLIFMDNMMPTLTGASATKLLRSEGFKGIIIGLTGDAMDEDVQTFMSSGTDIVMSKPLKFQELCIILNYLEQSGFNHEENMKGFEENGQKTKLQLSLIFQTRA